MGGSWGGLRDLEVSTEGASAYGHADLCRVGAQPPTVAEEGACLGESAPGVSVGFHLGWELACPGADISIDSPQWI